MDQDSATMVAAFQVPLPIHKSGKFEFWRMRIEQYIQMIGYALWEVIENGTTLPKIAVVEGVEKLKFNSIKDAKLLLEAVEKRFSMNLEILDEKLSQEDVNQKLLRSLSPEWNIHAVVWRNKADLETMSMDDLYNNLKVYVCKQPGFKDPDFPDKVYKVEKALYGLHQAPRAWYETLSTYLLDNRFQRGKIDKTLFIKRHKGDILLVQVYVDDIIFGSTKKELCNAFEKLMNEKYHMVLWETYILFGFQSAANRRRAYLLVQDKLLMKFKIVMWVYRVKTTKHTIGTSKKPIAQG
ncbi:putative ribonuclease H-like domain-containing protein [Tanacetum coccineum]